MLLKPYPETPTQPLVGLETPLTPESSVDHNIRVSIDSTTPQKFIKPRTAIIPNPARTELEGTTELIVKESINEALTKAGVLDSLIESERNKATVRSSLKENYAEISDAIRVIAENMRIGDSSSVKQRAAEKILELHGINAKNGVDFAINVIVDGNLNVANILNPHREE